MEFRVIGLNINSTPPPKVNESNARALGVSKEFLENEFKDSIKKINRNLSLQIQDLLNIYVMADMDGNIIIKDKLVTL